VAARTLDDVGELHSKRALVRVDINVPMENGIVSDLTRIERIKPTIDDLTAKGARVVLLAHFGRPKGKVVPEMSLRALVPSLSKVFGKDVAFAEDCIGDVAEAGVAALSDGDILLLENTRFHAGEEANDAAFADALAQNGDVFVNDAFSAAHRAHASTVGLATRLPACAGRTMQAELEALDAALGNPQRPVIALVGGAKVSTKLELLGNLIPKVDYLVVGGGMANTFIAALGLGVGKSLCEHDLLDTARIIMAKASEVGCEVVLPSDVVVADAFAANSPNTVVPVDEVPADRMILDAGPETVGTIADRIGKSRTMIWNGPLGAFEMEPFDKATALTAQEAARACQKGALIAVAGGGDTVSALNHAGVAEDFTYVSTAGGAFLEWMEGKELPGVAALEI